MILTSPGLSKSANIKNLKIRIVNARRPKMRCEGDASTPSNVSGAPSHGAKPSSSMSSISIFWVRGHLALGAPLTEMYGKIQKHFNTINLMYLFLRFETESFLIFMQAVFWQSFSSNAYHLLLKRTTRPQHMRPANVKFFIFCCICFLLSRVVPNHFLVVSRLQNHDKQ